VAFEEFVPFRVEEQMRPRRLTSGWYEQKKLHATSNGCCFDHGQQNCNTKIRQIFNKKDFFFGNIPGRCYFFSIT
jgi:hypothetical protein